MSGFLQRLVSRTIGTANVVRPRPVPRFLLAPDAGFVAGSSAAGGVDAARRSAQRDLSSAERGRAESADTLLRPVRTAPFDEPRAEPHGERSARAGARTAEGFDRAEPPSPGTSAAPAGADPRDAAVAQPALPRADSGTFGRRAEEPPRERRALDAVDELGPRSRLLEAGEFATAPQTFPRADRGARERSGSDRARGVDAFGVDEFDDAPQQSGLREREPRQAEPREPAAFPLAPMLARPRTSERRPRPDSAARSAEPAGGFTRESSVDGLSSSEPREAEPTIVNVTIGRIEVRSPAEPLVRTIRRDPPPAPEPREQLDAYLRERGKARR